MLTEKDHSEIKAMTDTDLAAAFRIMARQAKFVLLVGDRNRSIAVRDALEAEIVLRGGQIVRN